MFIHLLIRAKCFYHSWFLPQLYSFHSDMLHCHLLSTHGHSRMQQLQVIRKTRHFIMFNRWLKSCDWVSQNLQTEIQAMKPLTYPHQSKCFFLYLISIVWMFMKTCAKNFLEKQNCIVCNVPCLQEKLCRLSHDLKKKQKLNNVLLFWGQPDMSCNYWDAICFFVLRGACTLSPVITVIS